MVRGAWLKLSSSLLRHITSLALNSTYISRFICHLPFFLPFRHGDFVGELGLAFDATAALGSARSKRFAMVLEHGVVRYVAVEPDNTGLSCSLAPSLETVIKEKLAK